MCVLLTGAARSLVWCAFLVFDSSTGVRQLVMPAEQLSPDSLLSADTGGFFAGLGDMGDC